MRRELYYGPRGLLTGRVRFRLMVVWCFYLLWILVCDVILFQFLHFVVKFFDLGIFMLP